MYISACEGLGQLSQPVSALKDDQQTFQSKLSAIQDLLKRKFTDPNDPGLHERRKELRNLFNSVPSSQARKLHDRLKLRRKDDELSRLFHDRLATPTRNEMLGILENLIRTHGRQLTDVRTPATCVTPVELAERACLPADERWRMYLRQSTLPSPKPWGYFLTASEYRQYRVKQDAEARRARLKQEKAQLHRALGFESVLYSEDSLRLEKQGLPITAAMRKQMRQLLLARFVRKDEMEVSGIANGIIAITYKLTRLLWGLSVHAPNPISFDAEKLVIGRFITDVTSTARRIKLGSYAKGWEDHWLRELRLLETGLIRLISPKSGRARRELPDGTIKHKLFVDAVVTPQAILTFYLNLSLKRRGEVSGVNIVLKESGPSLVLGGPREPKVSVSGKGVNATITVEGSSDWDGQIRFTEKGALSYELSNKVSNLSISSEIGKTALSAQLPEMKLGEHVIIQASPEIEFVLLPTFWRKTVTQSPESVRAFQRALLMSPLTWAAVAPLIAGVVVVAGTKLVAAAGAVRGLQLLKEAPGVIIRLVGAVSR